MGLSVCTSCQYFSLQAQCLLGQIQTKRQEAFAGSNLHLYQYINVGTLCKLYMCVVLLLLPCGIYNLLLLMSDDVSIIS